jgi:phenylacetate-CoA ligase
VSRLEAVYGRLPAPLQHVAITAYGYTWRRRRLGGRFREYRDGYAQRLRAPELVAPWQARRLAELLAIAWEAPHYRASFEAAGLTRADLARIQPADLTCLPIVDKDAVRRAPDSFCPGGAPGRGAATYSTSGSTGTPLTVYNDSDDLRRAMALRDAWYGELAGVTYAQPRATFSGRRVEPASDSEGPFHRYNLAERQVYFSPYHLGPATVARYVEALQRHRPVWLTGYAGAIDELARLALEQGLTCPPLRAVITAAEPVPPGLRDHVRRAFGCAAHEEYGLAEQVCFALECDHGSLHVAEDAALVEILREDGTACADGEVGEVVGTGFIRESQPLIRYRTGDLAAARRQACGCGRTTLVLLGLEGRIDDVVVGADGRRVGRLSHVPKDLPGVLAMQFVQDRPGAVVARVVSEGVLALAVSEEIRRRLAERLGSAMEIEVEQVSALERTARGKIRGVIRRSPSG